MGWFNGPDLLAIVLIAALFLLVCKELGLRAGRGISKRRRLATRRAFARSYDARCFVAAAKLEPREPGNRFHSVSVLEVEA